MKGSMSDKIIIQDISVKTRIGVPDEERQFPQTLLVTVILHLSLKKSGKSDDIEETTDYYQVYQDIHSLAAEKPRKLLEHFAHEIAELTLDKYERVKAVEIEVKKFILPDTEHVAIRIKRKN